LTTEVYGWRRFSAVQILKLLTRYK
jgi:hypothetical protein